MKKAFDQTVRDLKRGVNKKVLKVSGVEQKILDATSNEPWGPHGSHLSEIAQATRNPHEYHTIMTVIWKRINDTGKNWRHVYKALTVLEYLVAHGSERVIDEIREHTYQISTLSNFQYIDSSGRDQGSNVRRKTQSLVSLVNDKERIREVRQKALSNQDKRQSSYSTSRTAHSSPGDSDDQYEEDHYKGNYGRDEERHDDRRGDLGYRDGDRYGRNRDQYSRDGDRYAQDCDERDGQNNYRDNDHRGSCVDYENGSRNMSTGHSSFHEDDHYTSSTSGRTDDPLQDERQLEHSEQRLGAQPNYVEATRDLQDPTLEGRNGDHISNSTTKALSPNRSSLENQGQVSGSPVAVQSAPTQNFEYNFFDAFDPRESMPVAPPATNHLNTPAADSLETDIFGSVTSSNLSHLFDPLPTTSPNANVGVEVPASAAFSPQFGAYALDPMPACGTFNQPSGNPFGDPPFEAMEEAVSTQQESFAPLPCFESSIPMGSCGNPPPPVPCSKVESITNFGVGGSSYPSFEAEAIQEMFPSKQESFAPPPESSIPTGSCGNLPKPVPSDMESSTGFGFGLLDSFGGSNYMQSAASTNVGTHATLGYTLAATSQQNLVAGYHHSNLTLEVPAQQLTTDIFSLLGPLGGNNDTRSNVLAPQAGPAKNTFLHSPTAQMQANFLQLTPFTWQAGESALQAARPNSSSMQSTTLNLLSQQRPPAPITIDDGMATLQTLTPAKNPSADKFETKSTVWADTLRRGLVNLNISGPKANPHAEIGIDFDSMNRKEKRTEERKSSAAPVASNITMGKAMGSGSGIGRAGATGLGPHLNPMMGMGMNTATNPMMGIGTGMGTVGYYGGSMNQPLGMGMGGMNMGIRTDMGMNMGMNQYQGMPMRPLMGMLPPGGGSMMPGMPPASAGMMHGMPPNGPGGMMPGAGFSGGMTGTGSYNFQQPYGGAHR